MRSPSVFVILSSSLLLSSFLLLSVTVVAATSSHSRSSSPGIQIVETGRYEALFEPLREDPDLAIDLEEDEWFSGEYQSFFEPYTVPSDKRVHEEDMKAFPESNTVFWNSRRSCFAAQRGALLKLAQEEGDLRSCHAALKQFRQAGSAVEKIDALISLHHCRSVTEQICRTHSKSRSLKQCRAFSKADADFGKSKSGQVIRSLEQARERGTAAVGRSACELTQQFVAFLPFYEDVVHLCGQLDEDVFHICIIASVVGCGPSYSRMFTPAELAKCQHFLTEFHTRKDHNPLSWTPPPIEPAGEPYNSSHEHEQHRPEPDVSGEAPIISEHPPVTGRSKKNGAPGELVVHVSSKSDEHHSDTAHSSEDVFRQLHKQFSKLHAGDDHFESSPTPVTDVLPWANRLRDRLLKRLDGVTQHKAPSAAAAAAATAASLSGAPAAPAAPAPATEATPAPAAPAAPTAPATADAGGTAEEVLAADEQRDDL